MTDLGKLITDYGAVSGADCTAAFRSAALSGRRVLIPNGEWHMNAPIYLTADHTEFEGETETGAVIVADPDRQAIVLDNKTCSLERLKIRGSYTTPDPSKRGVVFRAQAQARRVTVSGFGGHGFVIQGASPDYNACLVNMIGCKAYDNAGCGLWATGTDGNAGSIVGFRANGNLDWGINDASFLGNTYVGCWVENNAGKGFKTDGDRNRTAFLGCYCEPTEDVALSPLAKALACYPAGAWD